MLFLFLFFFNAPATTEIYTFPTRRSSDLGAAPVSQEILEFFSGFGLIIQEVYGQSEDTGPTTFNAPGRTKFGTVGRSEEHTSELQSRRDLVCRLLLEKKNTHRRIMWQHTT